MALPGYYYLGECFFHISLHKRLWYPKIEAFFGAFPPQRRSLRKTSPKTRAQIRNLLKRGGDLAALGPARILLLNRRDLRPIHSKIHGEKDDKPWDLGELGFWTISENKSASKSTPQQSTISAMKQNSTSSDTDVKLSLRKQPRETLNCDLYGYICNQSC